MVATFDCDHQPQGSQLELTSADLAEIMEIGAVIMVEALKADGLVPEDIDKKRAAREAIRRHIKPMSKPIPIMDRWVI